MPYWPTIKTLSVNDKEDGGGRTGGVIAARAGDSVAAALTTRVRSSGKVVGRACAVGGR